MTDQGPNKPQSEQQQRSSSPTKATASLPTISTPTPNQRAKSTSLNTTDLPPAPATVVVPPTPITPVTTTSNSGVNSLSMDKKSTTLQPTEEENVQYESPDEGSDMDASPHRTTASPSTSRDANDNSASRPALPPHAVPHRVASTPVPRSEMMAPPQEKERDDSALLQSPPTFVPAGKHSSSPHLFSAQRTPSPSSPAPMNMRDRLKRAHKRQSTSHVVHETTLGLQQEDEEGQRVVNQYKIGENLGKGAYASVVLGIDVGSGDKYVSRVLVPGSALSHAIGHQGVLKIASAEASSDGASSADGS